MTTMINAITKINSARAALKTLKINTARRAVLAITMMLGYRLLAGNSFARTPLRSSFAVKLLTVLFLMILGLVAMPQTAQAQVSCPDFSYPSSVAVLEATQTCRVEGGIGNNGILVQNQLELGSGKNVSFLAVADGQVPVSATCTGAGCGTFTGFFQLCEAFSGSGPCDISFSYTSTVGLVSGSLKIANNSSTVTDFSISGGAFTVADTTAPTVTSITRLNPSTSPTALDIVSWQVTFDEDVQNVDGTDFSVSGTTATITASNITDSTYEISLSGGDLANLDGNVILSFAAGQDIVDTNDNTLSNTTPTGTNDNTFVIEQPAPLPDAPTNLTLGESFNPSFTFGPATAATLSEIYTSWTLGALNGPSGTVLSTIQQNVYANGTCAAPVFARNGFFTGSTESGALLNLSQFPAGSTVSFNVFMENDAGVSPFSNCVSTVVPNADVTAPTLLSVVRKTPSVATTDADSLTWTVTFDEEAIGVDASDFTLTNTSASLSVTPVNPRFVPFDTTPLTTVYDVTATGGDLASFEGVVGLQLAAGQNITDYTEVNFLSGTVPSGANETYTLFIAPTVVSITRLIPATESTNADSLTWQIIFDKAVTNIDPSDFSVTGTSATITGLDQLSPTAFNVTASGGDLAGLSGTVTFGFASGQNITDTNNNELTNTAPTGANDATYTLDNTAPTIASIERLNPAVSPTDADTVSWKITFSDVGLQNIESSDFSVTGTTASLVLTRLGKKASKSGAIKGGGADVYSATLSGGDLADINGTVTLSLAAGQNITDEIGNLLANTPPTGINDNTFVIQNDSTAPSIAITGVPAVNDGNNFTATFTFSEDVTGFDLSDIAATNASVFTLAGGPSIYTALIAPNNNFNPVSVSVPAAAAIDEAGNENTAGGPETATGDTTPPILERIALNSPRRTNGDVLSFLVDFNEFMPTLDASDFTLTGTTATITSIGRYKFDVTTNRPTGFIFVIEGGDLPDLNGDVTLGFSPTHDLADEAGNEIITTVPTGENSLVITVDNIAPTTTVSMTPAVTGGTFTATITFSEDVTDFTLSEVTVTNGFPANLVPVSASAYTATITPLLNNDDDLTVSVPADIAFDEATNGNLASNTVTVGVDNTAPTLTSILRGRQTPTSPTNADVLWWTFQFSEDILNIDASDFVVTGTTGTVSYVGDIIEEGGSTFALTVSGGDLAGLDGDVTIALAPGNDITDLVGNTLDGTAPSGTNEDTFTVDNTSPSVVIDMVPSATNGAFTADFTFSEDVTGFVIGDISLFNGTTSNFSGSGKSYKATITPVGNGDITVGVDAGVATDAATNENTAAEDVTVTVDQISPDVTITDVPALTNAAFTATFTFTEDVSGFALADINIGNGTATQLAGGAAVYTALITPDEDGDVTVDVAAGIAQDSVGNTNTVATQAKAAFDGTAPSVSIKMAPSITNSAFDTDFEFSEDVTGFVLGDITVTNGTASDFSGSGDAYKATITPDGNGDITVAVNAGVAIDEATNENTAAEDVTVTVDNVAPVIASVTRTNPTTETTAADSLTWRVIFSEDVKNVDAGDFSVAGTTASLTLTEQSAKALDKRDSANVFDITIAGGDLEDLNATVTLSIASTQDITDTIGNALSNTQSTGTNDNTFKVQNDVTPPTLTITGVPDAVDGPFTATFSFSEEVQGFTEDDIIVTNGTTSDFQNTSGSTAAKPSESGKFAARPGNEFTVLITPASEGALTITVSERTLTDIAGNLNVAQVTTATVIDSTPPTVIIGALPNDVRGPFVVSVTFNEAVTGFELGDLTLTNATGSDFTSMSGTQYSALMTPIDQGTITIALSANKAVDAAGNGNRAANSVSTVFIDENFVRTRTQRIINNFVARRADQITINDPNLSNRLLNEGTKGRINGNAELKNVRLAFNGTATGEDANLAKLIGADKAAKVNLWTEASLVSIHGKTAENDLTLVYAGADYRVNKDTLIGVMGQVDWADEKDNTQNFAISGTGWMVGPYVVTRIADKLIFDGRAALGRSNNDISPSQTYTDNFKTSRWLLKGQLTGDLTMNNWQVNPNVAVIYFEENQKAYTDSLGINIPEQTVKLGRVTFGPRFSKSFEQDNNMTLTPSLNVRGVWDFEQAKILNLATGLANGTGKLRARTEAGLAATFDNGTRVSLDGFYDGIGASDFEAYGLKIGIGFPIQ